MADGDFPEPRELGRLESVIEQIAIVRMEVRQEMGDLYSWIDRLKAQNVALQRDLTAVLDDRESKNVQDCAEAERRGFQKALDLLKRRGHDDLAVIIGGDL